MVFVFVCKLQPVPLCTLCSAGTHLASHQQPRSYTWGDGIAFDICYFEEIVLVVFLLLIRASFLGMTVVVVLLSTAVDFSQMLIPRGRMESINCNTITVV